MGGNGYVYGTHLARFLAKQTHHQRVVPQVWIHGLGNHACRYLQARGHELFTVHGSRLTPSYTTAFRAITSRYHSALSLGVRFRVL